MSAATVTTLPATAEGTRIRAQVLDKALASGLLFAGSDLTIPVLNGVLIERVGKHLIFRATDRYTLLRETVSVEDDSSDEEWRVNLRTDDIRTLRQLIACNTRGRNRDVARLVTVLLSVDGAKVSVEVGALRATFDGYDDSKFPKVDTLLDKAREAKQSGPFDAALNPALLARVAKVGGETWRFRQAKEFAPVLAEAKDFGRELAVLLMPKRES